MTKPKATLGYTLGVYRDKPGREARGKSGGEKFAQSRGRRRMAGDIMNLSQSPGTPETLPLPKIAGGASNLIQSTGQPQPDASPFIGGAELRTPYLPQ